MAMNGVNSAIRSGQHHLRCNQLLNSLIITISKNIYKKKIKDRKTRNPRKEGVMYHNNAVFALDGNDGAAVVDSFGGVLDLKYTPVRRECRHRQIVACSDTSHLSSDLLLAKLCLVFSYSLPRLNFFWNKISIPPVRLCSSRKIDHESTLIIILSEFCEILFKKYFYSDEYFNLYNIIFLTPSIFHFIL